MIVVSNTSPLTSLATANLATILRRDLDCVKAGFFLGDKLYRQILEEAGETL